MRNYLIGICIFIGAVLIMPMIVLIGNNNIKKSGFSELQNFKPEYISSFKMYDVFNDIIVDLSLEDYLIGSVFAQMPAEFEPEAIKAQVVICHTYILRQHYIQKNKPTNELNGADFSNDSRIYQPYYDEQQARIVYGENYDAYYNKISSCVNEVLEYVILYKGQPIVASFHSMSGGMTESAQNVWGESVPYLVSIDSSFDSECEGFIETRQITSDEMYARLTQGLDEVSLPEDKTKWISFKQISQANSPLVVTVGDKDFKGSEIQELLSVRSPFYNIFFSDNMFTIEAKGYGHGVGLSQYGAQALAISSKNFDEILNHYYTDVNVVKIEKEPVNKIQAFN